MAISQIKRFLSDPFIFNAENLFAKENEDSENEKLEFERLSFDNLTNSSIRKDYIQKSIKSGKDLSEEFKQKLKNENLLPEREYLETGGRKGNCAYNNDSIQRQRKSIDFINLLEVDLERISRMRKLCFCIFKRNFCKKICLKI